jgi:acetyl/propionyl-CoA carboxylase alpha subunit
MHYDPLIAKLSVHGEQRAAAIERSLSALRDYAVLGPATNIEYLMAILENAAFRAGDLHTGFLAEHLPGWREDGDLDRDLVLAAAALQEQARPAAAPGAPAAGEDDGRPDGPWQRLGAFRLRGLD